MDDVLIAGKRSRKAASLADDRAKAGDLGAIEADVPDRPGRPAADIGQLQLRAYVAAHTTNLAIVTDGDGRIVWANEAFEVYTGFGLAEVIGKKPGSFLQGENTDQETVMAMRRAVANREFCQFDIINYTKAGEPYWVDLRISPVFDDKGVLINMISIAQDISDRKAAEARLEALNIDLHRSNQELEQFASIASHDLGEPLRMIAGFVDLLDARYGAKVGEDGRELIGFAADGARRMQQMMQDLLTLAKVGSTGTRSEALNARQPVDSALSNLSLALEDAGGTVSVGALPDLWGNHWQ
ncbi:MAG: PAS domain-containing protein, partial [Pseudomonadota bacterium]